MLSYFRTSYEVGIYNAAYPLAVSISLILAAFGYLYLPLASRYDIAEENSVGRIYEVTTKWLFIAVFPMFLTMVAFPSELISLIFGSRYSAGGTALTILSVGFFINAAVGRNRETLEALGATNFVLIANSVAFVLNIGLNYLLIPTFGIQGAAIASASSYIGLNFIVFLLLQSKFNISPFTTASVRIFLGLPILIGPLAVIARWYAPTHIISVTIFGVGTGLLGLVVVALLGGYEAEDAVLFKFVEDKTGLKIPLIGRFVPEPSSESGFSISKNE